MLLSIVMMVKNEEKNLERTLKSLVPLMNEINSELIILDTGSEDNTVSIAKKFTDKVYFRQWNNNFADMRNISISYAKGEWLLVLDADEELVEYKELVEFFRSNKYKKNNSATILLKSYLSEDGSNYDEVKLIRLFKKTNNFKYTGLIHEQPLFEEPIYNKYLAKFNHYGYVYVDEELRQEKSKRNMDLLLQQLDENPNDPYVNYQIGKTYITSKKTENALKYLEKSLELFKKAANFIPSYAYADLVKLYSTLNKDISCRQLCLEYIKNISTNDMDIQYYLGKSLMRLGDYDSSIKHYRLYLKLLNKHKTSNNNLDLYSSNLTLTLKESCIVDIIRIYSTLEKYEEIIEEYEENLMHSEHNNEVNWMLINALYKTDKIEKIKEYYCIICNTERDKQRFLAGLEGFLVSVDEENAQNIIDILKELPDNYGILNNIRMGNRPDLDSCKKILKDESADYYGDIIYHCLKNSYDLFDILKDVDSYKIKSYMNYIISYRRDIILDLYDYLIKANNTLDIKKIKIYVSLSKALLTNSGLVGEKSKKLFLLYKTYQYDYIKLIYNRELKDEELIELVSDREHIFTLRINIVEKLKENSKLEYIREMKKLVVDYPEYSKYMKLIIDDFEKNLNVSEELRQLQEQYKHMIEDSINSGKLYDADNMIAEYEKMFKQDVNILNMKAVIEIMNGNNEHADMLLKDAYILDNNNYDAIFNIGYLKENTSERGEAIKFYEKIVANCKDNSFTTEIKDRIYELSES